MQTKLNLSGVKSVRGETSDKNWKKSAYGHVLDKQKATSDKKLNKVPLKQKLAKTVSVRPDL